MVLVHNSPTTIVEKIIWQTCDSHHSLRLCVAVSYDKAAAVRFLQQRGILHNPRICANCVIGLTLNLRPTKGDRWRCSVRGCRREIGLRKNSWLEYSNLPCRICGQPMVASMPWDLLTFLTRS